MPLRCPQLLAASIVVASLAPSRAVAAEPAPAVTVIEGATLLDGNGGPPVPDALVVVAGDRIVAVGRRDQVEVPGAARRIEARGRYLVPGFIDTHAHTVVGPVSYGVENGTPVARVTLDPEVPARTLRSLLAHGVTTIRDPGGDTATLVGVRDAAARGELVGPRLFVAGSVIDRSRIDGLVAQVASAEEVRAEVARQAAAGVDFVKLYATLTPDLMAAGIEEAHAHGLPAIAHTLATTWTEAAGLGLDAVLHILPGSPALLPESEREGYAAELASSRFLYTWFERADLEGPEISEMIDALVAHQVAVDPTLVMWEAIVRGDQEAVTSAPTLALAAPSLAANWRGGFHFNVGWTPEDFPLARAAFAKAQQLARRLHERGVVLTAGTDANNPWVVPGPSFHRELELLSEAGIPPLEVLSIATRNGARALGRLAEFGTIEPGKRADLVLLQADPAASISATRAIDWVMQAGIVLRPAELLAPLAVAAGE